MRQVDAVVTVNEALADHCERSGRSANAPRCCSTGRSAGTRRRSRPDLIREAAGLPPTGPIVLFVGRLGRERGLEEASEAVLQLAMRRS